MGMSSREKGKANGTVTLCEYLIEQNEVVSLL